MTQITLSLNGISVSFDRFASYVPRQMLNGQAPTFSYSASLNAKLNAYQATPKQIMSLGVASNDEAIALKIHALHQEQQRLINANPQNVTSSLTLATYNSQTASGIYCGILVTDEVDQFVEYATSPTRANTGGTVTSLGNGYISYYGKFAMGLTLTADREYDVWRFGLTLTELAKLTP